MEVFNYEVMDGSGNILKGDIHAEHSEEAKAKLKEEGYWVIQVEDGAKAKRSINLFQRGRKVTDAEKTLFSRQLAAMLNAGIPITRAIFTLSRQATNPTFKKTLEAIAENVESGTSISAAFGEYPSIFDDMYLGMIESGEVGGTLGDTLVRLSDQLQKEKTLKDNIRSATIYPVAVVSFAIVMMIAMLVFLVPVFQGFFPEDADLPVASMMIISLSESIRGFWYIWLAIITIIIGSIYLYAKTERGSLLMEKIRLKIPGFGTLFHHTVIARLARTFSTLLANGIPVIQALESSGRGTGSILIERAIEDSIDEIQEGKNVGEAFEQKSIFPPIVSQMIMVGEETGTLPSLLSKVAEFYEDEVATLSKTITSMIEPILLIFVGVIVGGMLVSLYLPIFTVITQSA